MRGYLKRTWVEVDLEAIAYNYLEIRKRLPAESKMMCVVKADAYGHGAEFLTKEYESLGADWFAVSNIEEAIQLRDIGVSKPILILGYTPVCEAETLSKFSIAQAVLSEEYAVKLSEAAKLLGKRISVHIKVDSGMSRIGIACQCDSECEQAANCVKKIHELPGLFVEGIFTHFAVSDCGDLGKMQTEAQYTRFTKVVNLLKTSGYDIPLCHCSNSGAILDYSGMRLNMVRAGIILYGLMPSENIANKIRLKPAMQLKTVISQIKTVDKNTAVSYGGTFVTNRKTRIATVPIGYADGYLRCFSNRAEMLLHGKRVPVIGRVCMDQLMIDVTDVDQACEGDCVTVFGNDGDEFISVDDLASLADSINYEIICLLGKRVPRIYMKNGRLSGQLNYILRHG